MNLQEPYRKSTQAVLLIAIGIIFSLVWWVLASTGDSFACPDLTRCLISVLGGFLPAALGLLVLKSMKRRINPSSEIKLGRMLAFASYPILVTILFLSQMMMDQPALEAAWFYHPGVLTVNLMAVLLIGPIGDRFGDKNWVTNATTEELPTNQGKIVLIFTWWAWHLPFIVINGSALVALNFPNILMAAYLLTILTISWLMSWFRFEKTKIFNRL